MKKLFNGAELLQFFPLLKCVFVKENSPSEPPQKLFKTNRKTVGELVKKKKKINGKCSFNRIVCFFPAFEKAIKNYLIKKHFSRAF